MAVAGLALHLLGVGGYRGGGVLVAVVLVVAPAAGVWWALGHSRTSRSARAQWVAVAAVLGLVATALIGGRAPHSTGVLAARMDDLDLPFFVVEEERHSGRSWCRPTCPAVERRYRVPDVGVQATMVTIGLALSDQDLLAPDDLRRIADQKRLVVRQERLAVEVRIDEGPDGAIEGVRLRYTSRRP